MPGIGAPPVSGRGRVFDVSLGGRFVVVRDGVRSRVQPWELVPADLVTAEDLSVEAAERKLAAFWDGYPVVPRIPQRLGGED
jgi:hypothetical protein